MKPTGAQPYEPGGIVALSFAPPTRRRGTFVACAKALRGVAFTEDGKERGLQAAGIPFVVTGMTNLFGTAEAEAARQLFYFIGDHGPDETAVEQAWTAANLGLHPAALRAAVRSAAAAKAALRAEDQQRWSE